MEKPGATDIALGFNSLTDTTLVENQATFNAVMAGDDFSYRIHIQNSGPNSADTVKLMHILPDSVFYVDATIPPYRFHNDSLFWEFNSFQPGGEIEISVSVQFAPVVPEYLRELISKAVVSASNDTVADNNFATDVIKVLTPQVPMHRNYNLTVSQQVVTDTSIIIAREPVPAVRRGDDYKYNLTVKNFGPEVARNFFLWDVIPDSISISNFSIPPVSGTNDSLFWQIDSLPVGAIYSVDLDVRVAGNLPYVPFPLLNLSGVIAENDTSAADNLASSLIYAIERPGDPQTQFADISVGQIVVTDSFALAGNDTVHYVRAAETYSYTIIVANISQAAGENVIITSLLPDSITSSNHDPLPEMVTGDSLRWFLGVLLPGTSAEMQFDATVASIMPMGKNLLIHHVRATASNENPALLSNNESMSTVINMVKPAGDWQPFIEAVPPIVKAGESISIRVKVTVPIESWDLWVYLADGEIDSSYGDDFIATNLLLPDDWTEVDPQYTDTKMFTENDKEQIGFELRVIDVFGEFKTARADVTIEREENFNVGRNVFVPDRESELPIKFKLSGDRLVRLEIYDITGTRITRIAEGQYNPGWNTFFWDGLTEDGKKIGSGFYIVAIHAGEYQAWKKLMIVR